MSSSNCSPLSQFVLFLEGLIRNAEFRDFLQPLSPVLKTLEEQKQQLVPLARAALHYACQSGIPFVDAERRIRTAVRAAQELLNHEGEFVFLNSTPIARINNNRAQYIAVVQAALDPVCNLLAVDLNADEPPRSAPRIQPTVSVPDESSLSPNQKVTLAIIRGQPKGQGISGKEIIQKLAEQQIKIVYDTLRKHVLPKLKAFGVVNHRAVGGYLISSP